MADNVTLNPMQGGAVVSTDQAADTTHVQVIKLGEDASDSRKALPATVQEGLLVNTSSRGKNVLVGREDVADTVPVPMSEGDGYLPELVTRRSLIFVNNGDQTAWVAGDGYAAEGHGIPLKAKQILVIDHSPCSAWYFSSAAGESTVIDWLAEVD